MSKTTAASATARRSNYPAQSLAFGRARSFRIQKALGWALGVSLALLAGGLAIPGHTQSLVPGPSAAPEVPFNLPQEAATNLVRWNGTLPDAAGRTVSLRIALYQNQAGGLALWSETQSVKVDKDGRYSALLGIASADGLPRSLFEGGLARWVEARVASESETENALAVPRSLLAAVPYAFKAADAETLDGRAAEDYVTREDLQSTVSSILQNDPHLGTDVNPMLAGAGAAGALAYWSNATTLGNSALAETNFGNIALNAPTLATANAGVNSPVLQLGASTFFNSSLGSRAQQLNFGWQAVSVGNGTSSAGGKLDFVTSYNNAYPAPSGLSIAQNGLITFVPGQQFPGTLGSGTVTPGYGLKSLDSSGSTSLSVDPTVIPTLVGNNSFRGNETFDGAATFYGIAGAIKAAATAGTGITASGTSVGVSANATAPSGVGLAGQGTYGVVGTASTANGIGLWGQAQGQANSIGVEGQGTAFGVTGTGATGISGTGTQTGVTGTGAQAGVVGQGAIGVTGTALPWANAVGVQGTASRGYGVVGLSSISSLGSVVGSHYSLKNLVAAVWGDTVGSYNSYTEVSNPVAAILGTADGTSAGYFDNNSPNATTIVLINEAHGGATGITGLFRTLMATTPEGTCGFGGAGDLTCTGQVKTLASTGGGARKVETYAMQSPENWMEDFGSGEVNGGVAIVAIDPAFAETVAGDSSYHVFLTPNGDSKGLYVTRKTATSFEVRESGGGTSSLSFDYRIVAKRRGFESQRLIDVTDKFNEAEARVKQVQRPSAASESAQK